MTTERPSVSDQVVPGRIEKVLFVGSDTKYLVRVSQDRRWEVRLASTAHSASFVPGASVFLQWSLSDGRLFLE